MWSNRSSGRPLKRIKREINYLSRSLRNHTLYPLIKSSFLINQPVQKKIVQSESAVAVHVGKELFSYLLEVKLLWKLFSRLLYKQTPSLLQNKTRFSIPAFSVTILHHLLPALVFLLFESTRVWSKRKKLTTSLFLFPRLLNQFTAFHQNIEVFCQLCCSACIAYHSLEIESTGEWHLVVISRHPDQKGSSGLQWFSRN